MTHSKSRPRVSMPFNQWPEFDRKLWLDGCKPDPFDDLPKPLAKWSKRHRESSRHGYGTWLKFLARSYPDCLNEPPAMRLTPDRLIAYITELHARVTPGTLANVTCDLYGIMISIAGDCDWKWLLRVRRKVCLNARLYPPKAKQFIHGNELVRIGRDLIARAYQSDGMLADPIAFRDGLIILMLIMVPVRITQFSEIQLGKHLIPKSNGEWVIHWDAPETKTKKDDDAPLPQQLVELLQIYLDSVRPRLKARQVQNSDAGTLWVGINGASVGSQTLRKIINSRTKAALGHVINPHVFRSSAATTFALEAPEYAMEAAALLGHTNFETTQRYYLLGRRVKAIRVAHAALDAVGNKYKSSSLKVLV